VLSRWEFDEPLTLKSFGLQVDASRSSTQICVEIFDKAGSDGHAGRAIALAGC